ncbi:MAG: helix-turn-helix domain-containing protein [Synergistaceae bacterium]|jgi:excisionase family DNA binding protein|nr:helix-turn-helix domain-containing protein [Synergistaceae bacterium]
MEYLKGNYMSVTETAEALGITAIRVQQLCQSGRLQAVKFARDWMIPEEAIAMRTPGKRGPRTKKEHLSGELAGIRAEIDASKEEQPQ